MLGVSLQITSPEIVFSSIFLLLTFYLIAHGNADGVVRVVVTEESDALLPCSPSTRENLQDKLFDWKKVGQGGGTQHQVFMWDSAVHYDRHSGQSEQFKGRVSHFQNELKHGNASIVIRETKVIDSGSYICVFPRLKPLQTFHIELVVVGCDPCLKLENKYGETAGAAPEPCTSIVDVTELGVVLKCDVRGASPEPKVEWQDSGGSILHAEDPQVSERGGRYDVSIQTTVSNTSNNRFHCVATQQLIGHRVQANITVSEKLFEETFTEAEINAQFWVGFISGVFALPVVLALFAVMKFIRKCCKKRPAAPPDPFPLPRLIRNQPPIHPHQSPDLGEQSMESFLVHM